MADLNVCVGIDAGTVKSKLGYSDSLSTRIITAIEGFDINALREEAEVFFDEPVYSCVIAVPETFSWKKRDDVVSAAHSKGFDEAELITAYEAMSLVLPENERICVCDFGASKTDYVILNHHEVIASEIIEDVCGISYDKIFAEYLSDLRLSDSVDEYIMREAVRMKHVLSERESLTWHGREITRDDFERLIYFLVKRSSHTADKLARIYKPERVILTGGCANIPLVRKVFAGVSDKAAETDINLIVKGVSAKARLINKENIHNAKANITARLQELRANIMELEDRLTRQQKDRLYAMFRQTEGLNDSGIITLMENLVREIKNASPR